MADLELRIVSLYPEYMSIYADRGNITLLKMRCLWRGIDFRHTTASLNDELDPDAHDFFYIGGGQDRDQRIVAEDMVSTKSDSLVQAVETGAVVLAVCGGYQLLGESYQLGDEVLAGLGLVNLKTVREAGPRLIGNVAIEAGIGGQKKTLAGFENHGGRTYLGPSSKPLGQVVKGFGNNGKDGTEGVQKGNLIGTYLHGPLLPKNVWLADHLTIAALKRRYGQNVKLPDLDDGLETRSHLEAETAAMHQSSRSPLRL